MLSDTFKSQNDQETKLSNSDPKCAGHKTKYFKARFSWYIVQELCESRGGRPGLSVLTSLLVFVDVKNY